MKTFAYTIIDLNNAIHRGTIRSWTKHRAAKRLAESGGAVVTLMRAPGQTRFWQSLRVRLVSRVDRILFFRNLMTMLKAGLNMPEALASSREQTNNPLLQQAIVEAERSVLAGQSLSSALAKYPKIFSPVSVSLVRIGERGGKLVDTLTVLVRQQEEDYRLLRKIRNALVYPTLIVVTMIAMVTLMMIVVIPRIALVYEEAGASLPVYTAALITISHFMADNILYLVTAVVVFILAWRYRLQASPGFRLAVHRLHLRLPLVGPVIKKLNLTMISRSLQMLIRAGLSIDDSLILTSGVASNAVYQRALTAAVPFVKRGVKLTDIFKGTPELYLPLFQKMVSTGEETGNLDDMFDHVATYFDEDIQHWTTNLSSLIEPILLLLTGVVVGGVAFTVIYPLWNFANIL